MSALFPQSADTRPEASKKFGLINHGRVLFGGEQEHHEQFSWAGVKDGNETEFLRKGEDLLAYLPFVER
jgi:hypothetical protein